jgi:hypothetical protein
MRHCGPAVFDYALGVVPQIDTIMWLGHAGITNQDAAHAKVMVSKLYTGSTVSNDVTTASVPSFPTKNVEPHATIFLFGCATAATFDPVSHLTLSPGQLSISQAFANHFDTSVQGFKQHVGFGIYGWDRMSEDYDAYHQDNGDPAIPVTVSPR